MFKTDNEFCIHLESLKEEMGFDTYLETLSHYMENDSDLEPEQIAKHLNRSIIDNIRTEAMALNLVRGDDTIPNSLLGI